MSNNELGFLMLIFIVFGFCIGLWSNPFGMFIFLVIAFFILTLEEKK